MKRWNRHLQFIKTYPYWERFKRDTWYYFHPISHFKDAYRFFKSGKVEDCDYTYNNRKKKR